MGGLSKITSFNVSMCLMLYCSLRIRFLRFWSSFQLQVNLFFASSDLPCSVGNGFWNFITTFDRAWADLRPSKRPLDRGLAWFEPVFTVDFAEVLVLIPLFVIKNQQSIPQGISLKNTEKGVRFTLWLTTKEVASLGVDGKLARNSALTYTDAWWKG